MFNTGPRDGVLCDVVTGPRRAALLVCVAAAIVAAGCGSASSGPTTVVVRAGASGSDSDPTTTATAPKAPPRPPPPSYPKLLPAATAASLPAGFVPAVSWRGATAVWIARFPSGITMLSFNQQLVELRLHSGTVDAGPGFRWGPAAIGSELGRLVAGFNGGFKLDVGAGGFMEYGHVGSPLQDGVGSIVTYTNGRTDIGSWNGEVPASGVPIASVRQNLPLLIDHGTAAGNLDCVTCWGATVGGVATPARSALGVTANGELLWAAGENLTVADLADELVTAGAVRAVELDINPDWVAGYLFGHRGGHGPLAPVPVVAGQYGVYGAFLSPYSRDFFTVVAK